MLPVTITDSHEARLADIRRQVAERRAAEQAQHQESQAPLRDSVARLIAWITEQSTRQALRRDDPPPPSA
jgi:hypothetical protein